MAICTVEYQADGVKKDFLIPFAFTRKDFIRILVDEEEVEKSTIQWLSNNTIRTPSAPAFGSTVKVQRRTNNDTLLVDYRDGSVLRDKDLNINMTQLLHVVQESYDMIDNIPHGPVGPQGPSGPTGPQGPEGAQGATGPQGIQGPQGVQGERGQEGKQGPWGHKELLGQKAPTARKGSVGIPGKKVIQVIGESRAFQALKEQLEIKAPWVKARGVLLLVTSVWQ